MTMLFSLGCLYVTPGIRELIKQGVNIQSFLTRHLRGDWGDICQEDKSANNHAAERDGMILSAYWVTPDTKIWIMTDNGSTTIMLPDEY
ncbi:TPA: plasmid related protein [Salmonella enterica subsp. enterica serovar Concord]|nr:plasmid related protein [Salmonella enterica subsp. enterica serovar Concord]